MMADLKQAARSYVGDGLPGDLWNNVFPMQLRLHDHNEWDKIKPIKTYAEYVGFKCKDPAMVAAIMEVTNPNLVARHDDIVGRLNRAIGDGVKTQNQAEEIQLLLDEMKTLMYGQ